MQATEVLSLYFKYSFIKNSFCLNVSTLPKLQENKTKKEKEKEKKVMPKLSVEAEKLEKNILFYKGKVFFLIILILLFFNTLNNISNIYFS